MLKQYPSFAIVILTHDIYILLIQFSLSLPYLLMRTYYYDEWYILFHVVLPSYLHWDISLLNYHEAECDYCFEKHGFWVDISEHVLNYI